MQHELSNSERPFESLPHYRRLAFERKFNSVPGVVRERAAVLRSDIVGFTVLTDRMVKGGIVGAEQLAEVMNRVIGRMAEIAFAHGGELTGWEGDAATIVWFVKTEPLLEDCTVLAVQAARAIHQEARTWLIDGAPIQFRSAISCGALFHYEIGGRNGEWRALLAGPVLTETSAAQRAAPPGQAVLGRSAYPVVGARCRCTTLEHGLAQIVDVVAPVELPKDVSPSADAPPQALPTAAARVLTAGDRRTFSWPGEFRVVTAAYVTLRSPDYDSPEDTLATLQNAALRVQSCLARFEGHLYLTVAADEGVTFICVFGLPPWSHEDDAARSVRTALALHREWGSLGLTSSTGIATGRIFCGTYSTKTGHEGLALVGPVMNMAARLMQLNAGVVCDEETRQAGRQSGRILARQLTPRTIKGKSDPITAYAAYDFAGTGAPAPGPEDTGMIGREMEFGVLAGGLAKAQSGSGAAIVVEGEAGIGKTTLVNGIAAAARERGLVVLTGVGDSTDQTTIYLAWRRVFQDLLALSDSKRRGDGAASTPPRTAGDSVEVHPTGGEIRYGAMEGQLPLLDEMLGREAVDNGDTALLRGQARADALARLLQQMLLEASRAAPLLLIIEDLHWLDPTSLALFAALAASTGPLLLVGAARGPETSPAVRRGLALAERVQWLRLEPLNADETGKLLARTLGARQTDPKLAAMFRDRTGGNPLFVEELSRMAFANRLLLVDGVVQSRLSPESTKSEFDDVLERQGLPNTIEGVIRRRLDGLRDSDVAVLRAASVVGPVFDRDLCAAGAAALSAADVERSIAALTTLGVIEPSGQATQEFGFRHAVVRDVVYTSMAFAERRQLHAAIGAWIEAHPRHEDVNAILGRHFLHAQRNDKAIRYLTAAGETAVRRYANEEATNLLSRAYELSHAYANIEVELGDAEKARLSLLLGRALLGLSRYEECRTQNEAALKIMGFATPPNPPLVVLAIVSQTVGLFRHIVLPRARQTSAPEVGKLREAILAFEALAESYYFSGATMRTLHAAVTMLNMSERLGPSAELARGCATLSGIAGFFRFGGASNYYSTRALKILARLDDPAAETWVFTLLGLSNRAQGRWAKSAEFFANVVTAAVRTGDHRRWRDGVEGAAINDACRGHWRKALAGLRAMFDSAQQDRDRRYLTVAAREIAYCELQLGDLSAVVATIASIKAELERGLGTEEIPTRLDFHAVASTVALHAGDFVQAAREIDAAGKAVADIGGKSSVTNTYWSLFLVARALANLWILSARANRPDSRLLRQLAATCRALSVQARSFPIAGAAAAIAQGYLAGLQQRNRTSARLFRRAAARADRFGMDYEARLARRALGETVEAHGMPFLIADVPPDAT